MPEITRRDFMKISGAVAAGTFFSQLGFDLSPVEAYAAGLRIKGARETNTICCYCSVGCGMIVHTSGRELINIEGDPEHPVSEGALCSKAATLQGLVKNPNRIDKVMYRAPYSAKWETKSWDWALDRIAGKVKESRDSSFMEKNAKGEIVNRCNGIASVGSSHINNEEGWLYQKYLRSMGIVYMECEARL